MDTSKNGRRRVGAIVAIAAGVALLAGGSTYALWSDTASFDASADKIISGDLALDAGTDSASYDVSSDRTADETVPVTVDSKALTFTSAGEATSANALANGTFQLLGHTIDDLGTWLIVPGDTVAVTVPYTVTLTGDNLVADLSLDTSTLVATSANSNMSYSFAVFNADGTQVSPVTSLSDAQDGALTVATFQANGAGQSSGVDDAGIATVGADGTAAVTLVVFGYFDKGATANMEATDVLGTVNASLVQVRNP